MFVIVLRLRIGFGGVNYTKGAWDHRESHSVKVNVYEQLCLCLIILTNKFMRALDRLRYKNSLSSKSGIRIKALFCQWKKHRKIGSWMFSAHRKVSTIPCLLNFPYRVLRVIPSFFAAWYLFPLTSWRTFKIRFFSVALREVMSASVRGTVPLKL